MTTDPLRPIRPLASSRDTCRRQEVPTLRRRVLGKLYHDAEGGVNLLEGPDSTTRKSS